MARTTMTLEQRKAMVRKGMVTKALKAVTDEELQAKIIVVYTAGRTMVHYKANPYTGEVSKARIELGAENDDSAAHLVFSDETAAKYPTLVDRVTKDGETCLLWSLFHEIGHVVTFQRAYEAEHRNDSPDHELYKKREAEAAEARKQWREEKNAENMRKSDLAYRMMLDEYWADAWAFEALARYFTEKKITF